MSTYNLNIDTVNSSLSFYQAEKYNLSRLLGIYGSSRLGMLKDSVNVLGSAFTNTDSTNVTHTLGNKRYELSNHLGNVLTVITDKPIPHNNSGTVDYWQASIASAYDYSPFGVMLTGRTFEGKQTICEDSTTFITQKPLEEGFNSWGSWTAMGNGLVTYVSGEMQVSNPNTSKKDIGASKTFTTGTGVHNVSFEVIGNTCATVVIWPPSSTPIPIKVSVKDNYGNVVASGNYTTAGTYNLSFTPASAGANYTLEFHMTKASAFCFFRVDDVLVSYDDTTTMTVCKEVEDGYRYGFQAQERDDEVSGKGNSYSAEFWQYDSRLGRRWNVDPVVKHNESPYATFANNPIYFNDPDGKDAIITINGNNITVSAKIYIMNDGKNKINVVKAQKAIMKYWGKEFSYTDEDGKKYNVKFDIQVIEQTGNEDPNDASKNWVRPMEAGFRSRVRGFRNGEWASDAGLRSIAHEIGHMLGLADQYIDIVFKGWPHDPRNGRRRSVNYNLTLDNELMGAPTKEFQGKEKVSQRDIDGIAKYALNRFTDNKTVNGKVILDEGRLQKDGYLHGLAAPSESEFYDMVNAPNSGETPISPHEETTTTKAPAPKF